MSGLSQLCCCIGEEGVVGSERLAVNGEHWVLGGKQ